MTPRSISTLNLTSIDETKSESGKRSWFRRRGKTPDRSPTPQSQDDSSIGSMSSKSSLGSRFSGMFRRSKKEKDPETATGSRSSSTEPSIGSTVSTKSSKSFGSRVGSLFRRKNNVAKANKTLSTSPSPEKLSATDLAVEHGLTMDSPSSPSSNFESPRARKNKHCVLTPDSKNADESYETQSHVSMASTESTTSKRTFRDKLSGIFGGSKQRESDRKGGQPKEGVDHLSVSPSKSGRLQKSPLRTGQSPDYSATGISLIQQHEPSTASQLKNDSSLSHFTPNSSSTLDTYGESRHTLNGSSDYRWVCTVYTGDQRHAGTRSEVRIDVYGEYGAALDMNLNPNYEKFERNSSYKVQLNLHEKDLGSLHKIRVRHNNSGSNSDWLLERITLEKVVAHYNGFEGLSSHPSRHPERYDFICNKWFSSPKNGDIIQREIPASGPWVPKDLDLKLLSYRVRVVTGEGAFKSHSGTDAQVYACLYGSRGDSGTHILKKSLTHTDKFESGHTDEFLIEAVSLGHLKTVRIGHNNSNALLHKIKSGGGAGWFLERVDVHDPSQGSWLKFPCSRWLHSGKDDGKIERVLEAEDIQTQEVQNYDCKVVTSAQSTPGSRPAEVYMQLIGKDHQSTPRIPLLLSQNASKFDPGQTDRFKFSAPGVGLLVAARMGYSGIFGSGLWKVSEVRVKDTIQSTIYVFKPSPSESQEGNVYFKLFESRPIANTNSTKATTQRSETNSKAPGVVTPTGLWMQRTAKIRPKIPRTEHEDAKAEAEHRRWIEGIVERKREQKKRAEAAGTLPKPTTKQREAERTEIAKQNAARFQGWLKQVASAETYLSRAGVPIKADTRLQVRQALRDGDGAVDELLQKLTSNRSEMTIDMRSDVRGSTANGFGSITAPKPPVAVKQKDAQWASEVNAAMHDQNKLRAKIEKLGVAPAGIESHLRRDGRHYAPLAGATTAGPKKRVSVIECIVDSRSINLGGKQSVPIGWRQENPRNTPRLWRTLTPHQRAKEWAKYPEEKMEYKVRWAGEGPSSDSWEPGHELLKTAEKAINVFKERRRKNEMEAKAWQSKKDATAAAAKVEQDAQRARDALAKARREQLSQVEFRRWCAKKDQQKAKSARSKFQAAKRTMKDATTRSKSLKQATTYCLVPHGPKSSSGVVYIETDENHKAPSRPLRWLYGGRLAAGVPNKDTWDYTTTS